MLCRFTFPILAFCVIGFASGCSASGGGGGAVQVQAGAVCGATSTTDICGGSGGQSAHLHCASGVWTAVEICPSGSTCVTVSGGLACKSTNTGGGDTVTGGGDSVTGGGDGSGDTGAVDGTSGSDTKAGDDTTLEDTGMDVLILDTGKDVKTDIGKDTGVKDTGPKDTGPSAPTWGSCSLNDKACLQSCEQSSCADAIGACQNDAGCSGLEQCFQGCVATPIVMPAQSTPLPKKSGETDQAYCERVCTAQAPPSGLALDEAFLNCLIGMCLDCSTSASAGISKASCQAACGGVNKCADEFAACTGDSECLDLYGCLLKCDTGDAACQTSCADSASSTASSTFSTYNTCYGNNKSVCVAP